MARLVVLGGDARETAAAAELARAGHHVTAYGQGAAVPSAALEDLARAAAVIGPVRGATGAGDAFVGIDGPLPIPAAWPAACRPGTLWLLGGAGPWLRQQAEACGLILRTYGDRDAFTTLNAVPTAEGAICEAGRLAGRTVWGERALVVGGGRCAQALVRDLLGLGARVVLAARSPEARARAEVLGAETLPLHLLAEYARSCRFVFNTVPALLVDRPVLTALPAGSVVLDVATAPGGTDFAAADALGIRAALLPGIPGRWYPVTAGRILAGVVAEMLEEWEKGGDGR